MTSWKSSLVGIIAVVLGVIQAASHNGDWLAAVKDHSVQLAIAVAVLGFVSKDSNVTGGSVGQPSTPTALDAANQAHSSANPPIPKPAA